MKITAEYEIWVQEIETDDSDWYGSYKEFDSLEKFANWILYTQSPIVRGLYRNVKVTTDGEEFYIEV
jgi:hypothetical protein